GSAYAIFVGGCAGFASGFRDDHGASAFAELLREDLEAVFTRRQILGDELTVCIRNEPRHGHPVVTNPSVRDPRARGFLHNDASYVPTKFWASRRRHADRLGRGWHSIDGVTDAKPEGIGGLRSGFFEESPRTTCTDVERCCQRQPAGLPGERPRAECETA